MSAWSVYTCTAEIAHVQLGAFTRHVGYYTCKKKWPSIRVDEICASKKLSYCALVNYKNMLFSSLEYFTSIALI
jgi:hypothetical protein